MSRFVLVCGRVCVCVCLCVCAVERWKPAETGRTDKTGRTGDFLDLKKHDSSLPIYCKRTGNKTTDTTFDIFFRFPDSGTFLENNKNAMWRIGLIFPYGVATAGAVAAPVKLSEISCNAFAFDFYVSIRFDLWSLCPSQRYWTQTRLTTPFGHRGTAEPLQEIAMKNIPPLLQMENGKTAPPTRERDKAGSIQKKDVETATTPRRSEEKAATHQHHPQGRDGESSTNPKEDGTTAPT